MNQIPPIANTFKEASVFKTLAFLNYEFQFTDEEETYNIYKKYNKYLYVHLDSHTEAYQIINNHGHYISAIDLLRDELPINHFNHNTVGDVFQEYLDNVYDSSTPDLKSTSKKQLLLNIWQPRSRIKKTPHYDRPNSIEAVHPDHGFQSCIITKEGQQTNLLFILNQETFQPFFLCNSHFYYALDTAHQIVINHSFNDIMLSRDYALHNKLIVSYHYDINPPSFLEQSSVITIPLQTDIQINNYSNSYFTQKFKIILSIVQFDSPFEFQCLDAGNQITIQIYHPNKKTIAQTLSHFLQIKNKIINTWLMSTLSLHNQSELRNFSHDEVAPGFNIDSKYYSITMQTTYNNIIIFTDYFAKHLDTLTLSIQEYRQNA